MVGWITTITYLSRVQGRELAHCPLKTDETLSARPVENGASATTNPERILGTIKLLSILRAEEFFVFMKQIYTVESVTASHPDKICDRISDAILDAYLSKDPYARVAMEAFGAHDVLLIGGEVTSTAAVDAAAIARSIYFDELGYEDPLTITTNIIQQSPDIAQGVDAGGAGDQGIMYGYATDETPELLSKGVVLAHKLAKGLEELGKNDPECSWLRPKGIAHGKTQVTIQNGKVISALVSCQHREDAGQDEIKYILTEKLFRPVLKDIAGVKILVNPTGKFVVGGFVADTGLTGRKIMVDTYGGLIPHGGGAFSGKDPTKVDRSAAYMARFAAKNIVANGYAKECLVSVAYAIGRADPLMIHAEDQDGKDISSPVKRKFDFRPQAIIERLNLRRPIYKQTAAYGHFGKANLPWEQVHTL